MANFLTRLLSIGGERQLQKYERIAGEIGALEPSMQALSDDGMREKTAEFRSRLAAGETLDDLLPEAFALVREAAVRTLGMRHFDVQLIGGMVLHDGQIAEMKTGEGKTLVSTLAGYLNALAGNGVHIVTVNDYLAKRDSEWMGRVYKHLGMSVGLIQAQMDPDKRIPAYQADVTYGTNTEFGFDYLRDNMVTRGTDRVQRGHGYAIVDEVDSILIDEARTPLIISGAGTKSSDTYIAFAKATRSLREGMDFEKDESKHTIMATEEGLKRIERNLGYDDIYSDPSGQLVNHLQQALRAEFLYKRDVNYVVMDGEVKIVDEFTGRLMEGRRYSEGLHQALEAKEGVLVREENQTLATITLQNYFRLYDKLAGMTGTAITEDAEFREIYKLPVVVVPANRPLARDDKNDLIYRSVSAKFKAVADDVAHRHAAGQPVLVGTISIENSEQLSRLLDKRGIKHEVLNAKLHEREAHIVAQAGRSGAVTIATNMAGRGTDILLGGNPDFLAEDILRDRGIDPDEATEDQLAGALVEAKQVTSADHDRVVGLGGLSIIGTERHDSRRIDNQLRGRAGRQGDPGVSQFYLSLEDDLMRLFGGTRMDRIASIMERTQIPEDMPIEAGLVSKAIESAQRQVESMNFASRKHVLEYDDVMNKQREVIYAERNLILDGKDISSKIDDIMSDTVEKAVLNSCPERVACDDWDFETLDLWFKELSGLDVDTEAAAGGNNNPYELTAKLLDIVRDIYRDKEQRIGVDAMRRLESQVMLRVIDTRWMDHLQEMDYLKEGIGLRAMGQRDPLVEYKTEAYDAFGELVNHMYEDYLRTILRIQLVEEAAQPSPQLQRAIYSGPVDDSIGGAQRAMASAAAAGLGGPSQEQIASAAAAAGGGSAVATYEKDKTDPYANVGRNDPCPCGSGKKYKRCHGQSA